MKAAVKKLGQAVKNTIPVIAEAMEKLRANMIVFRYQLRHIGRGRQRMKDYIHAVQPNLVRYTELQAEKSELNREVKRVENEMKRLQGRIVAEMGRSCTATANSGGVFYSISYKPTRKPDIGKEGLIRLKAQHPDIYEDYVTVSESRRFYVKRKYDEAA